MAGTVETLHHKFISKLNTLEDLGLYVHNRQIADAIKNKFIGDRYSEIEIYIQYGGNTDLI